MKPKFSASGSGPSEATLQITMEIEDWRTTRQQLARFGDAYPTRELIGLIDKMLGEEGEP